MQLTADSLLKQDLLRFQKLFHCSKPNKICGKNMAKVKGFYLQWANFQIVENKWEAK